MRGLLVVLLATGAFAAPFSIRKEKSPSCNKRSNRFHHTREFPYNYEGETVSSIAGASSARSGLKIRARCIIKAAAPCQHVLRIDSVELWEAQSKNPGPLEYTLSQGSPAFAEELQAHDLVFRTDEGRVTEVLSHPGEPSHVLNVKRGILSAMQVQFVEHHTTLEEDDVVGRCRAQYHIKSRHLNGRPKVVYKSRNLSDCSDHAKTDLGIHVHSYDEQPVSLLKSHSACKLYLTAKNRAQRVVCEEEHVFRPFSAGYQNTSGAITTARQVLDLQPVRKVEPLEISVDELRPVSLKYEHSKPQSNEEAVNEAFFSITHLSRESQKETKPDSAQHFSKLVFGIRKLNTEAMQTLWQKVHNEEDEKIRDYLYDALPHCGTGACAKVMSNAVRKKLVSNERGNMFLTGLALAGSPTEETIEHVLDLCEENPGRTSMLTLGTLLHKFCEASPLKCSFEYSENTIARAENFLKSQLGDKCDAETPEELESILITLKAIGNAGLPVKAEDVLFKCALNPAVPMNMSIAALEALRRMPCSEQITRQLLGIYGDYDLDVELRIAAYLALMKCPSPEVFQEVARILKNEVNNQVGSFVWSHMTNAMDSTEPVHGQPLAEMMREALSGMKLREFNLNRLRFSRAWEGSFYSDILRFGGSAQSHLIYHPNSFFPRSAMVNLTVDILGASINVLETAARFEGFEILIEQFFGDDGYYPDERIMKMFNLKPHEDRDKVEKKVKYVRGRRSIDDDLNRVEKHLNKLHRTMDNRKHHPSGALSVKVFGNEMRLASFDDISWLNDEVDNINMVDILLKLAQGGKKTFTKSLMFLDAETTVPTILGLPLKLSAKGTTVGSLELSGKFDIRNMFWGRMSFDVRGYAKPSAVVDISGRMGVSAFYADAGVLVNSSLYTATQIKGNATYIQGETLKFELGAPEDPVQIINISSSLFTTLNDKKIAIDGTPRRIEPAPCLNMTRLLGVTFCSHLSLPLGYREYESPFFPFSGPSSFSISMKRTDPKLTKYQLIAERLETEDENKYDIVSRISTPGATWERNFEANGTLWLQKDGKFFQVSTGALGHNFGRFEATYNNISHAVNLTYSAKDAVYGYPIVLNGHFFNNSNVHTKELGIEISASYKNYTIRQMAKFYNKSHAYGYISNITYWPNRYLYSAGELNIPNRSLSFVTNHTCTQSEIHFHGKLGEEESPFVFGFTNKPTRLGVNITGRYLREPNEGFVRVFLRPFEQSFSLRGSYLKMGDEKGIRFTASHDNKNRVLNWYAGIVNSTQEKSFKANATILAHKAEAMWTFFNFSREKGIKFNGTLLNKTIDSIWSYFNIGQQKGLKLKASGLNKTLQAGWTFFNHSHVKSLKFNASFVNKTVEAVWSYVNFGQEKGVKLNASLMNKTLDAVWSYFNFSNEKGLRFNVSTMNRTAEAVWSYFSFTKKKGLAFNATAFNRTISTSLTFLNYTKEKSIRFNMTALNKTLEAVWSYISLENERGLRFNASALNQTISAMLSYMNLGEERGVRFNASVLNETIEAAWTFLNLTNERSLQFKARALNRTVTSALTFSSLPNQKSIKFNASVLNKTAEVAWVYADLRNEKVLKLNVTALNKSVTAVWSYLQAKHNKSISFYASAMNRTMESVFTFFNLPTEKGLKINMAVMNRSMNTSLVFFKHLRDMGLRLNVSSFNKSVELMSKVLLAEKEKKLIISATYQNYTIALVGLLKNISTQKAACFYPLYFGRTHGKICLIYTNTSTEKSMALNMTILNRTGELKTQWFNYTNTCAARFTARCNKTTFFESWLSFGHKPELKTLHMNVTVFNKSTGATFYFQNKTEKAVGLNVTILDKEVGIKGIWLNEKTFKEAGIILLWNRTVIATTSLKLISNPKRKTLEFRGRVGRYVVEQQNVYITENERKTEFVTILMFRNGSQSLFFDSSSLVYARKEKSRELAYYYNLKVMGRSFHYGWNASYNNFSTAEDSYHEAKISLMYSKDKWVSLAAIYRNTSEELSTTLVVEYLPKKTMKHFLIWHKQRNTVELGWQLLPRKPILWKVFWNTHEGFSINSIFTFFNKKIMNWFKFSSISGEYKGHFEIFPAYPVTVNGTASEKRGLLLTTEIGFLTKTWNHKIEFDRAERRLLVSLEVFPRASLIFGANWNMEDGLQITTNLKGFSKSLHWKGVYDNLTKTFTSDLTILKQKLIFTKQLDVVTKTLKLTLTAFGRHVGFVGRFDWKNYIASSYLIYQKNKAGWFLRFNPASRGIVFNITFSPNFSGQIVGDMPDDSRLQLTIQRKFGVNVVNESRLTYHLNPESSRFSLTWNTTTLDSLAWRAESLKMFLKNVTLIYYNLTVRKARNLTQGVDIMIKKLQQQIRPHALKLYTRVKSYDYKGLMENTTMVAQNMTYRLYNATIRVLNNSIENLPTLVRNASELYKRMCQNATDVYRRFRTEVLPPIIGNVTLHVKNISRDLKLWVRNVSVMMSGVTVRGEKISDIANRVSFKVREMTSQLVKTLNVKTRELIAKIREIEIRKQKLGPLYDRYMMKVMDFTCGFNATCTLNNVTIIAKNLTLGVRNITVLNKTLELHFLFLKNRTLQIHQKAVNFTRNLTIALPTFLRNVSIQAIHLIRNLTKEVRILTQKTMMVALKAQAKMMKTHRPLINFVTKVVISLKRRTMPLVVNVVQPVINFARELKNNLTIYTKPMAMPLLPMALDMMYQIRNITVRSVPIGHAFDKALNVSVYTAVEAFTMVNHSLSSNISAAIAFIRENSQKTPEEIVDLTIQKSIEFFNMSKRALNQSVELSFNLTRRAAQVFNRTIVGVNKTLTKVLQMRPDEIVEIFIRKMQNITRNVTKEVLHVTEQLRSLDLVRPVKVAWYEMDLKGKLKSFDLKVRWGKVLQRIRAFNIQDRALRFKFCTVNMTLYVLKELEDLTNVTYRALKLTRSLLRMEISKEDFVNEFIAIGQEGRRVLLKYANLLKNTSLELSRKLRNSSLEMAERLKNTTIQKGLIVYKFLREHGLSFYSEHREEGLIVYNIYKDIIMKIYEGVKREITAKVNAIRDRIIMEVETVVKKLRQYENMTYEEIVEKVYEFARKQGLALYRNVSMRAMKVFNDTKNVTLRAYNYTLLLANRTTRFALKHFKMAQNLTLRFYNMTRMRSLKYYNLTRYYILKYSKQYYNLTRHYALYTLNITRAFALRAYNKTQAMALRGIRYLNETFVPRAKEYYVKGVVIIQRYINKTVILIKESIKTIKDWYHGHKEMTAEEVYFEVYGLAERKYGEIKDVIRKRLDELQEKLKIRTDLWKTELQKLNMTVMNVTGDLISVYNQTVNITLLATKDLVAIFSPYANIIQNNTILYLVKAKNFSLPLLEMARNATLKKLTETQKLVSEGYKELMARKDVQAFIERHRLEEHYAKAEKFVRAQYKNVLTFVQQTKPRAEAKLKEVIFHVNVTLPNQIKALYNSIRQTYEGIVGNPKAYVNRLSNKAVSKAKEAFKDTPIEEIFMHEIWGELFEEARQHELVEVGQDLVNYTAAIQRRAVDLFSKNVKLLVTEGQRRFERMVESLKETRARMMKKFEELKRLKLREIVEHEYVFKAIDLAKNLSLAGENIAAEVRNLTRKWLGMVNFCNRNFTARILNCTSTLKKHYNRLYEEHIIPLYENCTALSQKYKQIARHYVDLCRNMSLRGLNITRNWTTAKMNMVRMWMNETMEKGVKYYREQLAPLYYNKVLPYYSDKIAPFYNNCTSLLKELKKNVTERVMTMRRQAVNLTQRAINLTLASEPYAMLRRFGKMTVRESVIEGRALYIGAYNYTLNLTRSAINMTLEKMNMTKTHLTQIIMNVQKAIPLKRLLNATRAEITETAVFMNRYYGIEVAIRHRLHKSLDTTRNLTRQVVDYHAPRFLKTSALKTLEFVNKTILFVNRTVGYLNVTIQNVTYILNKTLHDASTAIKKTIIDFRMALPKYIQVKEGSVTVIIPHPRPVSGTFKMLAMDSVQTIKDLKRQALEKVELMKSQVKVKMGNLREQAKNLTGRVKTLTKAWVAIADNKTLLYRQTAYKFVIKMYNLAKTHPVTRRCINATLRCLNITRDFAIARGVNLTQIKSVTEKYLSAALNLTRQTYLLGLNVTRSFTHKVYKVVVNVTLDIHNSSGMLEAFDKSRNYTKMALNTTFHFCQKLCNKTLVQTYLPMALNFSSHWYRTGFNATRNFSTILYNLAFNVSLDIYNSSSLREAFDKGRNYSKVALNGTLELYQKLYNKTRLDKYLPIVLNYSKIALNGTLKLYQKLYKRMLENYLPIALNLSRQWYRTGLNTTRNFTLMVYKLTMNVSMDVYNSSSLVEALEKVRNYSIKALNATEKLYRALQKDVVMKYAELYNLTMIKYVELYNRTLDRYAEMYNSCMELYRRIAEHETTLSYTKHAQNYLEHSRKMIKNRARHLQIVKRYWQKRINHKVSQISRLLNPATWIPPFNSTAMIFGGPHVYTFDNQYYTFPGYRHSLCTYVLARDVRDNEFTILSQETAIIIITEDSSVKIDQDGRVESVIKISTSGEKLSGVYVSELPVQSANTTVKREGSFIVFRHDLGLEVICDVEHYLCSFNIGRWYHGRMAGLLGTNNNEYHDEMMTSNNSIAASLIEFVNSWEVTRDPKCQVTFIETEKAKCTETSYIQRCRALFKDRESPLGHLKSVVDPEPFIRACEIDYKDCESETPKDMKHCNTTAAYVKLVRLQGEWADYLPECARCGINQVGQRWLQRPDKMVDVVILVHETSVLKSYAEKLPTFLTSLTDALDTYSFRFGVVGYGGQSVHSSPHAVTLDGQHMNDLMNLEQAIEHLDFTGEPLENETSDALDAILFAARTYAFRPGATKIFLLLDNVEHENDTMSMSRVSRMLDASDITLNVIGKYKKFRGEIIGQDYRGKVFYRKKPEIGTGVVELPQGEYVALMRSTQGSVFGLPFLGSHKKNKFGALQKASISTWKEQIKRDQLTCKECFCARGDAGQGKVICKNNSFHNKC